MANITNRSPISGVFRDEIVGLIGEIEGVEPLEEVVKNLNAMLTALDYNDVVLVESRLSSVFEALARVAEDCITRVVGQTARIKGSLPRFWSSVEDCPPELFQQIGETVAACFDSRLQLLAKLRDGVVKSLSQHEYRVDNSENLHREADELRLLKEEILTDWPWQDRPLPEVDRSMVARSRTAIRRGDMGESLENLLNSLRG